MTADMDFGPLFDTPQIRTDDDGRHWDTDGREHRLVDVDGETTWERTPAQYVLRATYAGQRVRVIQALPGAQWAIELEGVPVSVSTQSLSDFRSERAAPP